LAEKTTAEEPEGSDTSLLSHSRWKL